MKQVYIAGPIADKDPRVVDDNINRAVEFAGQFLDLGWSVIVPHSMYSPLRGSKSRRVFLESDFEMVRRADAIFLCPGWENSAGTLEEIEVAEQSNTEILHAPISAAIFSKITEDD